jgi:hypothetical protein
VSRAGALRLTDYPLQGESLTDAIEQ